MPNTTFHSAPYKKRRFAVCGWRRGNGNNSCKHQQQQLLSDKITSEQLFQMRYFCVPCSLHLAIHTMLLLISTWLITPCYLIIGVCCRDKCVLTRCCCSGAFRSEAESCRDIDFHGQARDIDSRIFQPSCRTDRHKVSASYWHRPPPVAVNYRN